MKRPSIPRWLHKAGELQNRERIRLLSEMSEARGLVPLLMKQRNGYRWSEQDKLRINAHFRRLAALSPYLVVFVAPGGFFALPVLAWWLDRRRQQNRKKPGAVK